MARGDLLNFWNGKFRNKTGFIPSGSFCLFSYGLFFYNA